MSGLRQVDRLRKYIGSADRTSGDTSKFQHSSGRPPVSLDLCGVKGVSATNSDEERSLDGGARIHHTPCWRDESVVSDSRQSNRARRSPMQNLKFEHSAQSHKPPSPLTRGLTALLNSLPTSMLRRLTARVISSSSSTAAISFGCGIDPMVRIQ